MKRRRTKLAERSENAKNIRQLRERRAEIQPELTDDLAYDFAKLLASGVPPMVCLSYLHPAYYAATEKDDAKRERWLKNWSSDKLLLDAVTKLNNGEWQDLDPRARLQIALDKHMAELAHFLYTHSFERAEGQEAKKLTEAADRLTSFLTDNGDDSESGWQKWIREFIGSVEKAPDLPALPVPMAGKES